MKNIHFSYRHLLLTFIPIVGMSFLFSGISYADDSDDQQVRTRNFTYENNPGGDPFTQTGKLVVNLTEIEDEPDMCNVTARNYEGFPPIVHTGDEDPDVETNIIPASCESLFKSDLLLTCECEEEQERAVVELQFGNDDTDILDIEWIETIPFSQATCPLAVKLILIKDDDSSDSS